MRTVTIEITQRDADQPLLAEAVGLATTAMHIEDISQIVLRAGGSTATITVTDLTPPSQANTPAKFDVLNPASNP